MNVLTWTKKGLASIAGRNGPSYCVPDVPYLDCAIFTARNNPSARRLEGDSCYVSAMTIKWSYRVWIGVLYLVKSNVRVSYVTVSSIQVPCMSFELSGRLYELSAYLRQPEVVYLEIWPVDSLANVDEASSWLGQSAAAQFSKNMQRLALYNKTYRIRMLYRPQTDST